MCDTIINLKPLAIRTIILLPLLGACAYAQKPKECDNGTIKGTYGYSITGLAPTAAGPLEQFIGVGIRTHDGDGKFTQVQTEKRASSSAVVDIQSSGTYTVNADCTGTLTSSSGAQLRFVIAAKGKEIRWLLVSPPAVTISGHGVRQ